MTNSISPPNVADMSHVRTWSGEPIGGNTNAVADMSHVRTWSGEPIGGNTNAVADMSHVRTWSGVPIGSKESTPPTSSTRSTTQPVDFSSLWSTSQFLNTFSAIDKDKNGFLTNDELGSYLKNAENNGTSVAEYNRAQFLSDHFNALDINKNGLNREEITQAASQSDNKTILDINDINPGKNHNRSVANFTKTHTAVDKDKNGLLSKQELSDYLNQAESTGVLVGDFNRAQLLLDNYDRLSNNGKDGLSLAQIRNTAALKADKDLLTSDDFH